MPAAKLARAAEEAVTPLSRRPLGARRGQSPRCPPRGGSGARGGEGSGRRAGGCAAPARSSPGSVRPAGDRWVPEVRQASWRLLVTGSSGGTLGMLGYKSCVKNKENVDRKRWRHP